MMQVPNFCKPGFGNHSYNAILSESSRVHALQSQISNRLGSLKDQTFVPVQLKQNGKEISKIEYPMDAKSACNTYAMIKTLMSTSTDSRLRELIRFFSDCDFTRAIKDDEDMANNHRVIALFFGIKTHEIPIDGYIDELNRLIEFINDKILKKEGYSSEDQDDFYNYG